MFPSKPPPLPAEDAAAVPSPSGGLLQGFRKKTMRTIVKYATPAAAPSAPQMPRGSTATSRSILSPKTKEGSLQERAAVRIKRFDEHDTQLRRLQSELNAMLHQLQAACLAMTGAVESFTQTFRYDSTAYEHGVDYLATLELIRRQGAHVMEQAIRFTVLDPLASRLARHSAIKQQIAAWHRLRDEMDEVQLSLDFQRATRQDKEERRARAEARLLDLQKQVQSLERQLIAAIDDATSASAIKHQTDLFGTLRLQLAMFFYHTNHALVSRLSETEAEIVKGVGPPTVTADGCRDDGDGACKSVTLTESAGAVHPISLQHVSVSKRQTTGTPSSIAGEPTRAEPSGVEHLKAQAAVRANETTAAHPANELRVSITVADFESGSPLPLTSAIGWSPPAVNQHRSQRPTVPSSAPLELPQLLELASNPVVNAHHEDSAEDRDIAQTTTTASPHSESSSMFTSLRRSISKQFGSPRAAIDSMRGRWSPDGTSPKSTSSSRSPTHEQKEQQHHRHLSLSSCEWRGVEACLWELDIVPEHRGTYSSGERTHKIDSPSLVSLLCKDTQFLFICTGFLTLEGIARLAKVNRELHVLLVHSSACWKRCVRAGGLSPANRSAFWLSVLYGSTPWQSNTETPHNLRSGETRRKIYEKLLVTLGTQIAGGLLNRNGNDQMGRDTDCDRIPRSISSDDQQLVSWLHDIDIDVARTCNKDIYAQDVAEVWDASFAVPAADQGALPARDVYRNEATRRRSSADTDVPSSRSDGIEKRTRVEAKIRRVLRAYVMYNPRVGYCQGMNFLVRLLIEVAEDEADCFWLFVGLCEPENDRNLYEPGLAVLQPLFTRFEAALAAQKPDLSTHFQKEGVPVAVYTARWFLTFFSTFETFGPSFVIHLLDIFVIDSWRIMFSMALVVLDELETQLLQSDMENILRILQFPRNHMTEPDRVRRRQLLRHALAFSITRVMQVG